MSSSKRFILLSALFTIAFLTWVFTPLNINGFWGQFSFEMSGERSGSVGIIGPGKGEKVITTEQYAKAKSQAMAHAFFQPGIVKADGEAYTKTLVIPRSKDDDVSWIDEHFGGNVYIRIAIYTAGDPTAELHPPKNKGNEAMTYLSYIIDHYDNLSDVNIFMHAHQHSWHNDELLDYDAAQMISRISAERVQREGYMNLRCHWEPGCPSWMHPGIVEEDTNKQEESMLAGAWFEIFPFFQVPRILAQPCCAQFAISRDRLQSIPLARYVFYRDWLLQTSLSDYLSGRVWEYLWQFVFTGMSVVCPKEHVCYCDGFGVCFGGEEGYKAYNRKHIETVHLEEELKGRRDENDKANKGGLRDTDTEVLEGAIKKLRAWLDQKRHEAKGNGESPMNRALEAGREWKDGDGF